MQLDLSPCDPQDTDPTHAVYFAASPLLLQYKCFTPSVASVIMISAPQGLLSASMAALLLGISIYLGFTWTNKLDSLSGIHDSQNVFIMFIIGLVVCILVYSISGLIQDDNSQSEVRILESHMRDWARRNADLLAAWHLRG